MAAVTLCDYLILSDGSVKNGVNLLFNLPSDFVKGTNVAKPLLQFRIDPEGESNIWIHVNEAASDPKQSNAEAIFNLTKGDHRVLHEALDGSKFKAGAENRITIFTAPGGGSASVFISDVVLFFQREVQI